MPKLLLHISVGNDITITKLDDRHQYTVVWDCLIIVFFLRNQYLTKYFLNFSNNTPISGEKQLTIFGKSTFISNSVYLISCNLL